MGKPNSEVRASLPKRTTRPKTPAKKTSTKKKKTPAPSSQTKKAASASSGGRLISTRSAAENKVLKLDLDKANKEKEELKRTTEELKSGDAVGHVCV